MSEPLVTQCPACGTRFKISADQLDAANGAVRCGACLEVFAGADCLIEQSTHNTRARDDHMVLDDPLHPLPDQEQRRVEEEITALGNWQTPTPQEALEEEFDHVPNTGDRDESIALDRDDVVDDSATDWYQGTEILYQITDDDYAEPVPAESDPEFSTKPSNSSTHPTEAMDDLSRLSLNESIDEISLAMVEVSESKGTLRYYLSYGFLSLLLLGTLGGQYLWFNKHQLAAREDLRSYYVEVCRILESQVSCNLPDYVNLSQISTRKLIVRSHPAIRNALIIDAIILNSGAFAQPFPKLELKFTDLDFKTIASRRFEANEYLGGELTGMRLMPALTEVRVSLEIIDPGNLAVSYELYAVHP